MQDLGGSGTPVLYTGHTVLKGYVRTHTHTVYRGGVP